MVSQLHDHDTPPRVTCREWDAAMFQAMAAKQLDAHKTAFRIGLYVGGIRERLKGEMPDGERHFFEAHVKEHEDWHDEVVGQLEAYMGAARPECEVSGGAD